MNVPGSEIILQEKLYRCYVEKRPGFDVAARALQTELSEVLRLPRVSVRLFNRYDVQRLPPRDWPSVMNTVLSEPVCDICYEDTLPPFPDGTRLLCVEPLPGQFDMRADSCEQCIQMLLGGRRPDARSARIYAVGGADGAAFDRVRAYLINPVECREAALDKPDTLPRNGGPPPGDIPVLDGFIKTDDGGLDALRLRLGLAMTVSDLLMIREYFAGEDRDPTITEIRVLDTYWSDHCRHTTFNTVINSAGIRDGRVQKAYELFLEANGGKPVTLMNIATAAMRRLRGQGGLPMLDLSDEVNACTVRVGAEFADRREEWLLFFKNETHNHPTEVEPYGGAATCIGGAIRDPLSGRAYVYQSMRITGAGDPRKPVTDTLPGKLPQRKLTVSAADGFSAYGNQIGLATGYVRELYHEGYIAKRLETGAVIGAAPLSSVRRESPAPGDVVVVLGGRTGRDGIGGATGSSKTHGTDTVSQCASEVQKGNAPEEHKLQRLFRDPAVTRLIKRCNDFGAGGAAVAIGELADGVEIDLDALPVKYEGLDGTDLAISESQERMAVVIAESDLPEMTRHAEAENIEASAAARITEDKRLVMLWRGKAIVDIARDFLDTNGAERRADVVVPDCGLAGADGPGLSGGTVGERLLRLAGDLRFCSQKGLVERFDHSVGAASVFEPYGGTYALTETQVMAAMLPARGTRTASVMAYGADPYFTEADPFGGAVYAVVTSVAKLAAAGVPLETVHLSLQEYFPRADNDPARWGRPFAALLGAFSAQMGLKIAAIGGKDSMSGSFGELDVPPTLISFAVGIADASRLISPEFKGAGHPVYLLETPLDSGGMPDYTPLRSAWDRYAALCRSGHVLSAWACEDGGVYGGIMKMALGNMIGFSGGADGRLFGRLWGSILFEADGELEGFPLLGYTQDGPALSFGGETVPLEELRRVWEAPLEGVFPVRTEQAGDAPLIADGRRSAGRRGASFARPKAVIPVFPGTNSEYDTAGAIERAGGSAEIVLIRNLTPETLRASAAGLEKAISSAQMVVFPGGFSGGDEPDGSGKFIVSLFRGPRLAGALHELLDNRDGLILGICNGFQALIKLGLLPYGRVAPMTAGCPTLTFNRIGRHQARYISARVSSVLSPWLSKCQPGEIYVQPVSHGEGRLTAPANMLDSLRENGQIAFQYVDHEGLPSMDVLYNPNGSVWAIEGLCGAGGRVLGKMAHMERCGREYVAKNVPGNKFLPLFEGGVSYFK
ncbi:MAG: phosphoribosylformylglycinamidine synthase [Oscillospiraceae bacterium]|jgi:phosphoribosylformylglycinamidine synthase|nr:phosphoribosylformylglycinamidine synthase [Oscillospiraceae bacterium]